MKSHRTRSAAAPAIGTLLIVLAAPTEARAQPVSRFAQPDEV